MKLTHFGAGGAVWMLASALALADVRTDYDHGANFESYHTYSWGQVKTDNPLDQSRIKDEIDRDLQAKGWQVVPSGGQTMIFATDNIRNEQEMETVYNGFGGGWGGGWGFRRFGGFGGGYGPGGFGESTTSTINQPVSHLVVDVFDSASHSLLFRGVADNNLGKNSDKNTRNVDKNIDKMFDKFPPKARG